MQELCMLHTQFLLFSVCEYVLPVPVNKFNNHML